MPMTGRQRRRKSPQKWRFGGRVGLSGSGVRATALDRQKVAEWANERHARGAKSDMITAAILVIGDEILSGPHQGQEHRLYRRISDQHRHRHARGPRGARHRGRDHHGAQRAAPPLHLRVHHRRHRADPRRHHRRLRRQGVRRDDRRRSARPRAAADADRREGHERGAAAHGAHSGRRRSHPQQGVGGAGLPHRQRACDGGRAVDHAGDARRGGADAEDRRQDAVGDGARRTAAKATSARRSARSPRRIPT